MPRPRLIDLYEGMQDKIKETAWEMMSELGGSGLSLREIARRMNLSAPALYNYYANREDLITALILDGFEGLAETMRSASDAQAHQNTRGRMASVLEAYRRWAMEYPTRYLLIYGTPIPGYQAPRETTVPAAVRIFAVLIALIEDGLQSKQIIPLAPYNVVPKSQQANIAAIIENGGYSVQPLAVYLGFLLWSECYKLVMPTLLSHLRPLNTEALFADECANLLDRFGFQR